MNPSVAQQLGFRSKPVRRATAIGMALDVPEVDHVGPLIQLLSVRPTIQRDPDPCGHGGHGVSETGLLSFELLGLFDRPIPCGVSIECNSKIGQGDGAAMSGFGGMGVPMEFHDL